MRCRFSATVTSCFVSFSFYDSKIENSQSARDLSNVTRTGDQIVPVPTTSLAASNRMIYANGELHVLPKSLSHLFVKRPPFSKPLIRYLLNDLFAPRKVAENDDESTHSFVERRFGSEVADYLIGPLVSGICAGDAKEISAKFMLRNFFEIEQKHGGVLKGLVKNMFAKKDVTPIKTAAHSQLHVRSMREKWNVFSFRDGVETLPKQLARSIEGKVDVKLNSSACDVTLSRDGVEVRSEDGQVFQGDHLICCVPAGALGSYTLHVDVCMCRSIFSLKRVGVWLFTSLPLRVLLRFVSPRFFTQENSWRSSTGHWRNVSGA